jgi:hypothetical protein
MDFAAIHASAPDGWVSENSFSRSRAVMAAYSSITDALTTVWNRRLANPVKARRAVLRGQKMAIDDGVCVKDDRHARRLPER